MSTEKTTASGGMFAGLAGLLMVACCMAGPAVIGAVAGASVGGLPGVGVAVLVAVLVTAAWTVRRRRQSQGGESCGC